MALHGKFFGLCSADWLNRVKNDFFMSLIDSPSTRRVPSATSSTDVDGAPHYSRMSKLGYLPAPALKYLADHSR